MQPTRLRVMWPATVVFFGVLPVILRRPALRRGDPDDAVAIDFRQFYAAAEAILHGDNPYPGPTRTAGPASGGPYLYPPLPALLAIAADGASVQAAGLILMAVLVTVALALRASLGVRDWRCYGSCFCGRP